MGSRRRIQKINEISTIVNVPLDRVDSLSYLGVTLNQRRSGTDSIGGGGGGD